MEAETAANQVEDTKQDEQDKFDKQANAFDKKTDELESKIQKITIGKDNDNKIREMSEKLDSKLDSIRKNIDENNQGVAAKKIKALENIIERMENLG